MKNSNILTMLFKKNGTSQRRRVEREFLPAALEIIETPVSPTSLISTIAIIFLFLTLIIWSCIGTVDVISTAQGNIIPIGKTKIVQPFETGVVRSIQVHDGQEVKAGDVLIELDPTTSAADERRYERDLQQDRLDIARLTALLTDDQTSFLPFDGADSQLVAIARNQLIAEAEEQAAKIESLNRQIAQKHAEEEEAISGVAKIESVLPFMEQQRNIRYELFQEKYGSRLLYLQAEQIFIEQKHELLIQKHRREEAAQAAVALDHQRLEAKAQYRKGLLADLAKAKNASSEHQEELVKATQRHALQILTAPVDGTIQQLSIHTVGGVVTPAQQLMVVVPKDDLLEVEAVVENQDIGFVHAGQSAEIKIDTFNFTRYGLLHGHVLSVSRDVATRHAMNTDEQSSLSESHDNKLAEPQMAYTARLSLDHEQMMIDGKTVRLTPGMTVTAEIKTGNRHIINYIISPIIQTVAGSMHER